MLDLEGARELVQRLLSTTPYPPVGSDPAEVKIKRERLERDERLLIRELLRVQAETLEWVKARVIDSLYCSRNTREHAMLSETLSFLPDAIVATRAALERLKGEGDGNS